MRILVTGGAGYVGSHAVPRLRAAGHDVWVYDNLSRGHRAATDPARLVVGNLADTERLASTMKTHAIEAVMNFAAVALVGESVVDPSLYYQTNVAGTLSLLDAMRAAGVACIVHSSTTAVVGAPDVSPIPESVPRAAINPYGRSKAMVEAILEDYAAAYGISTTALRYFNAAGASASGEYGEDHEPETHLIPITLSVALGQRAQLTIFGEDYPTPDGTCVRDYVHVEDLASAHLLALEKMQSRQLAAGKLHVFNLGMGNGYSIRQVVESCRRVTGHPIPVVAAPRRPGDPPSLVADATRARTVLGWVPVYDTLDKIVATAWNWHQAHPRGYAK